MYKPPRPVHPDIDSDTKDGWRSLHFPQAVELQVERKASWGKKKEGWSIQVAPVFCYSVHLSKKPGFLFLTGYPRSSQILYHQVFSRMCSPLRILKGAWWCLDPGCSCFL